MLDEILCMMGFLSDSWFHGSVRRNHALALDVSFAENYRELAPSRNLSCTSYEILPCFWEANFELRPIIGPGNF